MKVDGTDEHQVYAHEYPLHTSCVRCLMIFWCYMMTEFDSLYGESIVADSKTQDKTDSKVMIDL